MRKLSKRFVVAITPEHHTSKTCCRCFGSCGAWKEVEERMKKKVRSLRICQKETCKLPQNRDRTGASNIGMQFNRLFEGKPPIRQMNEEKKEINRL
jgi:transposase